MSDKNYQLNKKIEIKGRIKLLTGLHIGASNSTMDIGGVDSVVVRNPINNEPYIPGSSLKGKMRALIDLKDGKIMQKKMGAVENTSSDDWEGARAPRLFGNAKNKGIQRPSRLIVRDAELLTKDFESDLPYTEVKTEVTIDRITARAMPRTLERVPAGAEFALSMVLNVFSEDDEQELLQTLSEAMRLLELDYLGGSGSRGYGQIKFIINEDDVRVYDLKGENWQEGVNAQEVYTKYFSQFKENE